MNQLPCIDISLAFEGRFKMTRRKADTLEVVEETDWFPNLILDIGLDRFGTASIATYCKVGTSSTTPATNQTQLLGYVGSSSSIQANSNGAKATPPYYGYATQTYRFNAGVAAGTLREVGVGWVQAGAGNIWCRSLIIDANGNPTSITVLSDEVLDVTYELRCYPYLSDKVFQTTIGGVLHDCVLRAYGVTQTFWWGQYLLNGFNGQGPTQVFNGAIGAITSSPSGTSSNSNPIDPTLDAYVPGSYQRAATANWGLNEGNLSGGITAAAYKSTVGAYQMSFSPAIAKDNTKVLSLKIMYKWGRYVP